MRINLPNSRTFSKIFKKAIGADIVENINGREDDYLYSPWNGKINLGNLSNPNSETLHIRVRILML